MGKVFDILLENLESVMMLFEKFIMDREFATYCDLENVIGLNSDDIKRQPGDTSPYILATKDKSFVTAFEVKGVFEYLSHDDYYKIVDNITDKMNGYFAGKGHSITISFERDHFSTQKALDELAKPMLNTARRIGLNTKDMILSRLEKNKPYVSYERTLIFVYTHLNKLPQAEQKNICNEARKHALDAKLGACEFGQNPFAVLNELKNHHDTFIQQFTNDLVSSGLNGSQGIMLEQLKAHEAIKAIREMVNKEQTPENYRPVLQGDKFMPVGNISATDFSNYMAPRIAYQICSSDVDIQDKFISTGEYYHGTLSIELGPQLIRPFAELFATISREIPWRIRYDISSDGINKLACKQFLSQMTAFNPHNKSIANSLNYLKELSDASTVVCGMTISMATWATTKEKCKHQVNILITALQSWGSPIVTACSGDPVENWAATVPGFTLKTTANMLYPPLIQALSMCPLNRPASPWKTGSVVMRTECGKLFPIELGSSDQNAHIESITSSSGGGKSLLLNVLNNAEIHAAGRVRLPLITVIDVGPSSKGLIQLIRDSLPEERKNQAIYLKLQNSLSFTVNPFDTQLGARKPTIKEKEFLVNLLSLMCSDVKTKSAPTDVIRAADMLVEIAYQFCANDASAEKYIPSVQVHIDDILKMPSIREQRSDTWWKTALWYEIAELLFENNYIDEAILAQREAVPTLGTISASLNDLRFKQNFGSATVGRESLIDFMSRCFTTAASRYKIFTGRTTFSIGSETRVISIDLNDVINKSTEQGKLDTAIMYMFARQLAAKNYFLSEDIIFPILSNDRFIPYHQARIDDIKQERKVIAYDEFHNTGKQEAFVDTVVKDGREGRKWGVRTVVVSQFLNDFPDDLLNSLTTMYLMAHSPDDEKILRDKFKISETIITQYRRKVTGGAKHNKGSDFLNIIKTQQGTVAHILTHTVGAHELWAFSTKPQDIAIREKLYEQIGSLAARELLVKHFPAGSADKKVAYLKQNSNDEEDEENAISQIISELLLDYTQNHEYAA